MMFGSVNRAGRESFSLFTSPTRNFLINNLAFEFYRLIQYVDIKSNLAIICYVDNRRTDTHTNHRKHYYWIQEILKCLKVAI